MRWKFCPGAFGYEMALGCFWNTQWLSKLKEEDREAKSHPVTSEKGKKLNVPGLKRPEAELSIREVTPLGIKWVSVPHWTP